MTSEPVRARLKRGVRSVLLGLASAVVGVFTFSFSFSWGAPHVLLLLVSFVGWAVFSVDAVASVGGAFYQHGRDLREREQRSIPDGF